MAKVRSPIPRAIERAVRRRCGFGCVICGAPIYEYHHMDENPENNVAENITLLCGSHHTEATNRLLPPDQIAEANRTPFNLQHGVSSPYGLHFKGDRFQCVIGGNSFSSRLHPDQSMTESIAISVDDTDLISFRIGTSGELFLNATIFDENNMPPLVIIENALRFRATTWDIEFEGRRLTVREAARKILLDIEFNPPAAIRIERARLLCNGVEILVRQSHVFVVNSEQLFVGGSADNCDIGLQFGRNDRGRSAGFSSDPGALSRYNMPPEEVRRRERAALAWMEDMFKGLGLSIDAESPI